MRSFKWTVFLLISLTLSGCWSSRELNDLAIAVGMAIDEGQGGYEVTVQVADANEVATRTASTGRTPVIIYSETGKTISEALRRMTVTSPREIYQSHLRILVIGEQLARQGIRDVLDYVSRNHEFRNDFAIVVAKGTRAEDTLSILSSLEKIPALKLFNSLKFSSRNWSPTTKVNMNELLEDLMSGGRQPVLTGLRVVGDIAEGGEMADLQRARFHTKTMFSGLSVFKGDKLIGWLDEEESRAYNLILDRVTRAVSHVRCEDGGLAELDIIRSKTKMKGFVSGGQPSIRVQIFSEADIAEIACKIDLTKQQSLEQLEKSIEDRSKKFIMRTIHRVQTEYQSDIFGFGEAIRRADPRYWKQNRDNWEQLFMKLPVDVQVDVKIRRLGSTSNSFIQGIK